ncbi:MAG: mechanosensitive ion channel family protein [Patescibacteria group bacterium]
MLESLIITLQGISFGLNTAYDYALAIVVFIGLLIALKFFEFIVIVRLRQLAKRTKTDFDDVLINIIHGVRPPLYLLLSLFVAIQFITLPDLGQQVVKIFFYIAVVYEVIQAIDKLLGYGLHVYMTRSAGSDDAKQAESMIRVLQIIAKVVLWVIGLLFILHNLGVNVTSLVASLGIGGLAVALALQSVLSDLISSISIYMDKPFEVGDFVVIGTDSGTVKKIGIKTTRIKTLRGEELVVSNKELTSVRVQNFKKLQKRREVFTFGVTYETPQEKLEKIPKIVQSSIEAQDLAEFDRCHFDLYADSSLQFEAVYHIPTSDYAEYMDVKQAIHLAVFKAFAEEKIEFAYPTQTLYVNK